MQSTLGSQQRSEMPSYVAFRQTGRSCTVILTCASVIYFQVRINGRHLKLVACFKLGTFGLEF